MSDLSTLPQVQAVTPQLPIHWYFDPRLYELEKRLLFDAGPGYIGHELMVRNVGLIAAAGIGGVLAFSVSQRTREIGVRLALGAQRREVLGLVLRQGGAMVGLGLAIGVVGAGWLARFMQSLVFGIGPRDPLTLAAACLTLAAVALVASLGPARRATSVDPVIALRNG